MARGVTVIPELLDRVREIENVFIPMADGSRLAARLFLPADGKPAPVILEYLPYRKRDFMRERDEPMHRYFAAHGYAVARVDVRGTGDSDGVMEDEYSQTELLDGVAVIEWLAQQPFCDGGVGMMGISWGGFNSLQIAALRPKPLRAIITMCASDDRYADDAHYMGGCLLNENMQWGSILTTYAAMPPDPEIVGERWRAMWMERLEGLVAYPVLWTKHPTRDEQWRHGSVCEDLSAIECPVYAVGGWADGYSNAVGRLMAGLDVPRKGLIGPWAHTFPHHGYPGPKIGFLQEAIRWWDHWLRGKDTGLMDEPQLRMWMQDSVPPAPQYQERPGRWIAETQWPSANVQHHRWALNRRRLATTPEEGPPMHHRSPQLTGAVAGEWCAFGSDGEMPLDQRPDDGRSLVFDGEPLEERLEIAGAPVVELDLASSTASGMIAVRLCEVDPHGASTRITYGLLDLTHREGHHKSVPLVPGERYRVRVQLNDIAHAFSPGSRLRVAVSTSYWPIAWPSPEAGTLSVWPGTSGLTLPVRAPHPLDEALREFEEPQEAPGIQHQPLRALPFRRTMERDLVTNEVVYRLRSDGGEFGDHSLARLEELDLTLGYSFAKTHRVTAEDPLSAQTSVSQWVELSRGDWHVRIECETELACGPHNFMFKGQLRGLEGPSTVFERTWDETIPRTAVGKP